MSVKKAVIDPFPVNPEMRVDDLAHTLHWVAEQEKRPAIVIKGLLMFKAYPGGSIRGYVVTQGRNIRR